MTISKTVEVRGVTPQDRGVRRAPKWAYGTGYVAEGAGHPTSDVVRVAVRDEVKLDTPGDAVAYMLRERGFGYLASLVLESLDAPVWGGLERVPEIRSRIAKYAMTSPKDPEGRTGDARRAAFAATDRALLMALLDRVTATEAGAALLADLPAYAGPLAPVPEVRERVEDYGLGVDPETGDPERGLVRPADYAAHDRAYLLWVLDRLAAAPQGYAAIAWIAKFVSM